MQQISQVKLAGTEEEFQVETVLAQPDILAMHSVDTEQPKVRVVQVAQIMEDQPLEVLVREEMRFQLPTE